MSLWLAAVLACVGDPVDPGDSGETAAPPPTLAANLQPIFNRNCVGSCHSASTSSASLDLSDGAAYANLVGVASEQVPTLVRVAPGEPDASYLIAKLEGTHTADGGTGTSMPPYLMLAEVELTLFREWVRAGAAE